MLDNIKLEKVLFIDVETAPLVYRYSDLDEHLQKLWDAKFRYQANETPESQYKKAGIYAEFAKVICISAGYFFKDTFRVKSFFADSEKQLLSDFSQLLKTHFNTKDHLLCAHNGKEFDFPFLCRRMLVNEVRLPKILNLSGKKPWEVNHIDTMELWKFGDYKNFTSLNLLTTIFNIPTPKDDIDGSDVARVYWEENDMERIVNYCQKDVIAVAQIVLKFMGQPLIENKNITYL